ncbi:acyl-CoA-binding protein homolog 1-like [Onthophagus taurus]|uniref:acyl-CoA-binding protein homolog 1-like n=1 Tax=Onthophagus taurus TaxID=166361 RepID=UPI000C200865|nr:acyl-CoA-binding protein homolog 1-like [Onthophagus taurus]
MSLEAQFNDAAVKVKKLKAMPSNDDLLELYGLFKQATVGDNTTERPGMLDVKGKAKWDSWTSKKGMSKADAQQKYIDKVEALVGSIGLQ